jgi:alkylated DNA repair dioxygenase AlkB
MLSLFPTSPLMPEGFSYTPSFLTTEEEQQLLEMIGEIQLHTFVFQGYEAKRKAASFGFDWSFEKRTLSKGKEIPAGFLPLIKKVALHLAMKPQDFGELLILEYPEGAVINWHRDAPPFGLIAGISLLAETRFRLRPYDKANQGRSSIINVDVAPRSLYVMQGPARSDWEHSTAPAKRLRYSITLRTLR